MASVSEVPSTRGLEACLQYRLHGYLQLRWGPRCGRCSTAEMVDIVHSLFTYSATKLTYSATKPGAVVVVCIACVYIPWLQYALALYSGGMQGQFGTLGKVMQ